MFKLYKKREFFILYNCDTDSFDIESDLNDLINAGAFPMRQIDKDLFDSAELILSVDKISDIKELIPEEFI